MCVCGLCECVVYVCGLCGCMVCMHACLSVMYVSVLMCACMCECEYVCDVSVHVWCAYMCVCAYVCL